MIKTINNDEWDILTDDINNDDYSVVLDDVLHDIEILFEENGILALTYNDKLFIFPVKEGVFKNIPLDSEVDDKGKGHYIVISERRNSPALVYQRALSYGVSFEKYKKDKDWIPDKVVKELI